MESACRDANYNSDHNSLRRAFDFKRDALLFQQSRGGRSKQVAAGCDPAMAHLSEERRRAPIRRRTARGRVRAHAPCRTVRDNAFDRRLVCRYNAPDLRQVPVPRQELRNAPAVYWGMR